MSNLSFPENSYLLKKIKALKTESITLGEFVNQLGDSALMLVSVFCILPFLQPIPIPGVSTVLGLIIALQGIALIFNKKVLLTKRMGKLQFDEKRVKQIKNGLEKIINSMEKVVKTRGVHYIDMPLCRIICGSNIFLLALFLSLPLPLPGSNFIPAIGIFSICLGILERDLVWVVIGNLYSFLVYLLIFLGTTLLHDTINKLFHFIN
jgi:hypothetical protein